MRRALGVSPCPVVPVGTMGESPEGTLRVRDPGGEQARKLHGRTINFILHFRAMIDYSSCSTRLEWSYLLPCLHPWWCEASRDSQSLRFPNDDRSGPRHCAGAG